MKKRFAMYILALALLLAPHTTLATPENADAVEERIGSYDIEQLDGYMGDSGEYYGDGRSFSDLVRRFASGDEVLSAKGALEAFLRSFFGEAYSAAYLLLNVIAIALLFSLINGMGTGLGGEISETAFFACYLALATITVSVFAENAQLVAGTVKSSAAFVNAAAPILTTMLAASGSAVGAATVEPIMLIAAQLVATAAEKLLLPLLYSAGVLYITSGINEQLGVSRFAELLAKTVKWALCLMLTIFVGILGIHGFCAYSLDGASAKTAKFVFATAVPVVGGILSDTLETVMGCSRVVKNATGAAGVVAVLSIAASPVVKILASCIMLRLGAAIAEPISDRRISAMLSNISSVIALMAGIVVSAAVIFIVCIGAVMCLSGASM